VIWVTIAALYERRSIRGRTDGGHRPPLQCRHGSPDKKAATKAAALQRQRAQPFDALRALSLSKRQVCAPTNTLFAQRFFFLLALQGKAPRRERTLPPAENQQCSSRLPVI
jgi:hypothetical protein